ncbi:MAG: TonB-dependent receptor [Muribaculaceae bacterium]|nr:TonB-dependent receptor [Muribaculaceae bacterium]
MNFKVILLFLIGLLPALCASAQGGSHKISGTVTDNTGEPVIGASVVVENTNIGTVTDIDGNFAFSVQKLPVTLSITSVGYQGKTVEVRSSDPVDVVLSDDNNLLDEVVVIGYGQVRKADLAGSVAVLDSKAFSAQPVTTVGEALQGRVSGVNVISDGIPGSSPKIRIRGSNSINKSNEPLYVVDGLVRESGLEGLNPEDIASMQILKDASSTAIYGSRGANGVVIITTRKGKQGESQITFDASFGVSNATHLPKIMSTSVYAQALIDYMNVSESDMEPYLTGENPGVDWTDAIFRTGTTQNYKLVYTKGTEGLQTYVSANYMRTNGIIEKSNYERYAARANVNAKLTSWLDATVDIDLSHGIGHGIGGFSMSTGPMWAAFTYSPTVNLYVPDTKVYGQDPYNSIMPNNPLSQLSNPNERRRDILNGRIDLRFSLCKGLTFTTSNGVDYLNSYNYSFTPSTAYPGVNTGMSNANTNRWLLQTTNNLTYIGEWGDHNLTATAVWEATSSTSRGMSITGTDLLTESVGWYNIDVANNKNASNSFSKWTLMSGVARVIYNFNNRYMVTGTFRADGSSRLQNNKWSYFPSIALAWTISNEKFMQSITPVMNSLKLRTSFGIIGNQDISPYQTLGLLSKVNVYYGTALPSVGYWSDRVTTPDLKWERTKQFDIGVDASFLNGRFDVNLDWYYKRTSDALLQTTPPWYLGAEPYYVNAGEVSNTGVDLSITANIIQGGDWTWSSTVQGSYMKNKVEKLTALEPVLYSGSTVSILTDALIVKEGEPIGSFYGYRWAGIDEGGYDTYYTKDGEISRTVTSEDREVLGKSNPDFTLGWNNTVTWKNWSLNAFFNGSFGAKRLNALRYAMNTLIGNSRFVTDASWLSEVGKTMADPNRYENNYCAGESTKWLEKADYWRLENLSLAYDLKRSVTGFADIRITASVQNLFTITGYKGVNPATMSFGDVEWKKGVDMGTSPAPRTYTIGARFIF